MSNRKPIPNEPDFLLVKPIADKLRQKIIVPDNWPPGFHEWIAYLALNPQITKGPKDDEADNLAVEIDSDLQELSLKFLNVYQELDLSKTTRALLLAEREVSKLDAPNKAGFLHRFFQGSEYNYFRQRYKRVKKTKDEPPISALYEWLGERAAKEPWKSITADDIGKTRKELRVKYRAEKSAIAQSKKENKDMQNRYLSWLKSDDSKATLSKKLRKSLLESYGLRD